MRDEVSTVVVSLQYVTLFYRWLATSPELTPTNLISLGRILCGASAEHIATFLSTTENAVFEYVINRLTYYLICITLFLY